MFYRNLLPAVLFAATCSGVLTSQPAHAQGIGERLGARLDEGINRLGEEIQESWESLKKTVDQMGVQGRVYSRLRWDKQFTGTKFDVDVENDTVTLRGIVASNEAKQKAMQIASNTIGVFRVQNELTVGQVPMSSEPND